MDGGAKSREDAKAKDSRGEKTASAHSSAEAVFVSFVLLCVCSCVVCLLCVLVLCLRNPDAVLCLLFCFVFFVLCIVSCCICVCVFVVVSFLCPQTEQANVFVSTIIGCTTCWSSFRCSWFLCCLLLGFCLCVCLFVVCLFGSSPSTAKADLCF